MLLDEIEDWSALLQELYNGPRGTEALQTFLGYFIQVSRPPAETLREVIARVLGPAAEEVVVTLAEELLTKGRAEGKPRRFLRSSRGPWPCSPE